MKDEAGNADKDAMDVLAVVGIGLVEQGVCGWRLALCCGHLWLVRHGDCLVLCKK